jgi:glycosyltransferase involved in cell wall biosynthesis
MSVPCTYDEPKGLFVLEAMANGVPVVEPRRGSFPETVERTGGGILVEPDDPVSLADGIQRVWQDAELARQLRLQGPMKVEAGFGVAEMARRTIAALSGTLDTAQVNS